MVNHPFFIYNAAAVTTLMDAMNNIYLQGVAQLLVQNNLLDQEKVFFYQHIAEKHHLSLLQYLVSNHIICPKVIASIIAIHFGVDMIDLDSIDIESIPTALVNETLIQRHHIVPLFTQDSQLYVATDDPSQHDALKAFQFHTGLHITPLVAETHKLTKLINQLLNLKEHQGLTDYVGGAQSSDEAVISDQFNEDEPVVKFVKRIILDAIEQGASDIHFEPYECEYRIRYRQDGLLVSVASPPSTLAARIAARIKVMASLDISERRTPQDGRFRMQLPHQSIDFRVSTCPTVAGEKVVMRILDTHSLKPDIDTLGFTPQQQAQFLHAISRTQGMVLVTGPTGSGKTMTLYSALNILNTGEINVLTVEDPVEINVHGINQVNINTKAGLSFASTLRAFLRQDPDVIMIGEIRDLETAEIAIKAAQTGHLVLSTLHTNSATETLSRLVSMGIPSFNIASSISLIVAQRLVRRLCNACKLLRTDLTPYSLIELGLPDTDTDILHSYQSQGCNQCTNGYRGRIALFEVMPISQSLAHMIMSGKHALDLLKQAKTEGMITLVEAGLEQVKSGLTSIEEIIKLRID